MQTTEKYQKKEVDKKTERILASLSVTKMWVRERA